MANPYVSAFTELLQHLSKKYFPTLDAFADATGVGKEYLCSARTGRRMVGRDAYTAMQAGLPGTKEEMHALQQAYETAAVQFVSPHRQRPKQQKTTRPPQAPAIPSDAQFLHLVTVCLPKSLAVLASLLGTLQQADAPLPAKLQAIRALKRAVPTHGGLVEKINRYLQRL